MADLLFFIFIVVGWSCIGMVPVALAGTKRRMKKPIYLLILIVAVVIEVLLAIAIFKIFDLLNESKTGALIGPVIGATVCGYLYWKLANLKDSKTTINYHTS
jgi:hypothetical protein